MQKIAELKHCHDVAKCKTVFVESQPESHHAIRFRVSITFDALAHEMTKRALPNIPKQIVKSVVHTRPCTDPAFYTEPFCWLSDYLVIDSSSYLVACTPELAGLECCKHAISLKDYERKNEMFSAESLVVSLEIRESKMVRK